MIIGMKNPPASLRPRDQIG